MILSLEIIIVLTVHDTYVALRKNCLFLRPDLMRTIIAGNDCQIALLNVEDLPIRNFALFNA